jgi:hypothetical protein
MLMVGEGQLWPAISIYAFGSVRVKILPTGRSPADQLQLVIPLGQPVWPTRADWLA